MLKRLLQSHFFQVSSHYTVSVRSASLLASDLVSEWKSALGQNKTASIAAFIQTKWREEENSRRNRDSKDVSTQKKEPSVPKMVADLVEAYGEIIHPALAMDTMVCLSHIKPHYHHIGLLHLIDAYLEIGDLKGAQDCYERLMKDNLPIDQACAERFIKVAAEQCSISHMKLVLQTQQISKSMLLAVVEPLILSGYTKTLSQLLERYLALKPVPTPVEVASIVKEILRARIRRSLTECPLSTLEEEGVDQIEALLSDFTDKYDDELVSSITDEIALQGIDNYISFCSDWDGESAPEGLPFSSYNQSHSVDTISQFNYLEEQRTLPTFLDNSDETKNLSHRFLFEDITAQIAKQRPYVYPLYNGKLFNEEAKRELLYAEAVANDIFFALDGIELLTQDESNENEMSEFEGVEESESFESEDGDEFDAHDDEDEDDADDEDDAVTYELELEEVADELLHDEGVEKFFDKMRSAGNAKGLSHHSFNDMSQSIKSAYPTIMIEYAEDIFDGISEDSFVRDSLMHKSKKDGREGVTRNGNGAHNSNNGQCKKLVEGIVTNVEDVEKKGPDDEGGVTVGLKAPTIFKEES